MPSSVSVIVYDSRITAMNAPGGDVHKYIRHKQRRAAALAKVYAPKRSGELARSVRTETPRWGRNHVTARISARAPHAIFVIRGTGPLISVDSTDAGAFWLPRAPHSRRRMWYYEDIRGQKANNFLDRALNDSIGEVYYNRGARLGSINPFG